MTKSKNDSYWPGEIGNEAPLDIKCHRCGLLRPADIPDCPCMKEDVVSESMKKRLRSSMWRDGQVKE